MKDCRIHNGIFHKRCAARAAIWLGVSALLFLAAYHQQVKVWTWPHLSSPLLPDDSDVWLRLNQVRQWLLGGNFFDHGVPRTNAPFGGISIHWTRPLDTVEALLYHFTPAAWPVNIRLMSMAAWLPALLSLAIISLATKAAEQRMKHMHTLFCVACLAVFSPLKNDYLLPGNADHHGMLCLLWCGVLALITGTFSTGRAIFAGILLGVILWMDIEGFIPIGCVFVVLGLLTLANPADMKRLAVLTVALFLTVFAALFVEMPPSVALHKEMYDTLSIVQVTLMGLIAAGASLLAFAFGRLNGIQARAFAAGIAAALSAGAMWLLFPKFFLGPMADTHMSVVMPFLDSIGEMAPLWRVPLPAAVWLLATPILALVLACLSLHRGMNANKRRQIFILLSLLSLTLLCTAFHVRWTYYVQPIAVILAAGLLPGLCRARKHEFFKMLDFLPAILRCGAVIALLPLALWVSTKTLVQKPVVNNAGAACIRQAEYVIETQQLQKALGQTPVIVLTEKDLGGWMMFFTPYRVIAQNYHREGAGMLALADIAKQPSPQAARPLLEKRQVGAVFICPSLYAKDSWLNKLRNPSDVPAWLKPVEGLRFSSLPSATPLLFTVSHQP